MKTILIFILVIVSNAHCHSQTIIKMIKHSGGTYELPVEINGVLKINFIFDPGASEVSISPDIALTLMKTNTIKDDDWLEGKYYQFADGSYAKSMRFIIRELNIGGNIIRNVPTSISNSIEAPLLLGQSALNKLGKIQIDYNKNTLTILNGSTQTTVNSNSNKSTTTNTASSKKTFIYNPYEEKDKNTYSSTMRTIGKFGIYDQPIWNGRIITMLEEKTVVKIIGKVDWFYKVEYNGITGYIKEDFLEEIY